MKKNNLKSLYTEMESLGVEIIPCDMRERTAFIGPQGYLAIDYSKIKTPEQEKEVLMEEISHFEVYAFYPPDAPYSVWQKQEARARRHIFEKYYSPEDIATIIADSRTSTWEIAEQLELPERFVIEMLKFYKEVRNVDFDILVQQITNPCVSDEGDGEDVPMILQLEKKKKRQKADYKKIATEHFKKRKDELLDRGIIENNKQDERVG